MTINPEELREDLKDPVIQYFDAAPSEIKPSVLEAAKRYLEIAPALEEMMKAFKDESNRSKFTDICDTNLSKIAEILNGK